MNWKEFLKLDWRKIGLIIYFMLLSLFYQVSKDNRIYMGFPLSYYYKEIFDLPLFDLLPPYLGQILIVPLLLDIIFWYLLSCLIFWVYDKVKKK